MMTSFNRIWHLRELVFIEGGSPARCSSLLSVICSMSFLTHTDPCRRRKWNRMKLQAMKKSTRNSLYFLLIEFLGILTQGILELHLCLIVPWQPFSTRLPSEHKVVPTLQRVGIVSFFSYERFHKLYLLQELSYCSRADWLISTNNKRTDIKF